MERRAGVAATPSLQRSWALTLGLPLSAGDLRKQSWQQEAEGGQYKMGLWSLQSKKFSGPL